MKVITEAGYKEHVEEAAEYAIISSDAVRDKKFQSLLIISEAAWPVEDGELVVLDGVSVEEIDVVKQIRILSCLAAILLPGILLLARSVRKFGSLQEGNVKDGIEGAVICKIRFRIFVKRRHRL